MNRKILIVEDDADIARNLVELLESEGYRAECAGDGKAALEKLRNSHPLPSLILLDLMMPIMDGVQFRLEQKKDSALASIPVVVMTADGHFESKKSIIEADAYLKKPIDIDTLLEVVKRYSD